MSDDKYVLNEVFLNELFRACLRRKDILETCITHMKYHYIPSEPYKEIFMTIKNYYTANGIIPSFGTVYQTIQSQLGKKAGIALNVLTDIKEAELIDNTVLLNKFEEFIRDCMSVEFFSEFGEKYKSGDRDGARSLLMKKADEMSKFAIRGGTIHDTVFGGFDERSQNREIEYMTQSLNKYKVPFSIIELDELTYGGMDVTDTACMLMRSGVGKTKFLRHVGIGAVRRGIPVLHIQAEGSKAACLNGYDATWTACLMTDIKSGSIDPEKYNDLLKVVNGIKIKGADIYVHAFEQFSSASMVDVRQIAVDLLKKIPHIGLINIDYLELIDPADGRRYAVSEERARRLAIGNKMKNLALELETRVLTVTQANDIPPKFINDPDYVMTRHNTSECKSLANPFSFFFTGNQTPEEYDAGRMRIYTDKFRDHRGNYIVHISQNYKYDRFYDRRRTIEDNKKLADMEEKRREKAEKKSKSASKVQESDTTIEGADDTNDE